MNEHDELTTRDQRPAPFGHVFVATDFSAGAAQAIARAGRLPLIDGGRISVVHVLPDLPKKTGSPDVPVGWRRGVGMKGSRAG